ncbi:DUF6506 family protein [Chloroflexota bacterium]
MAQAKNKVVFMFWNPSADPVNHRSDLDLGSSVLTSIGVKDYEQAVNIAKDLVKEGAIAFELCGGFGNIGTARVAEAVPGVPVGVVKFDIHPLLEAKSGDQVLGLAP